MPRMLENRDQDGLRHPEHLRMVGKKYPTTMNGRQTFVDLIEGTMENDNAPLILRLMAANIHLKTEQTNMAAEKMEFERENVGGGNERQPEVILVLPSNGSELGHAAADDSGVESDDSGVESDDSESKEGKTDEPAERDSE